MIETKLFYTADDIAQILNVSHPTAYRIIRDLNDELASKGYIIINGRVPEVLLLIPKSKEKICI